MSCDGSERWVARDDGIVEKGPGGKRIASVDAELADWRTTAALLAAAPELLKAVRAARDAIDEAGPHLPLNSKADLLAVKAFGVCIDAILKAEAVDAPRPDEEARLSG